MKKQYRNVLLGLGWFTLLGLGVSSASAAPKLRVQVDQTGDFALIGNTLAQECRSSTPPPTVGTVGQCGTSTSESGPDVFWRSDSPTDGQAEANLNIGIEAARSTAVLTLPKGATVTHAFLYWAARNDAGTDSTVTLHHESGFESDVTALESVELLVTRTDDVSHNYQSVADITSIVKENGPGAYRIGGVDVVSLTDRNDDVVYAAWWMVVLYSEPGAPPRNLAVFDGLDRVSAARPQQVQLSGFKVPEAGFDAKLGLVAFEGDNNNVGDSIFFNPTVPASPDITEALQDGQNPADNFFNSTRSALGQPVSTEGDLPRLTGVPQSMSGVDIDVVDVGTKLKPGAQSATIVATSTDELYFLAGWVTSISTYAPDFSASKKEAKDVNGAPTFPGDTIEYSITALNRGNDASLDTVVTDDLPKGVTFVPGSLEIVDGDNIGRLTDASGDDSGEYNPQTRTVTVRIGSGADPAKGGSIADAKSVTVRFKTTVDADAEGVISNQAAISSAGKLGAPQHNDMTDGNGADEGAPPTNITVEPGEVPEPPKPDSYYGAGNGVFAPCSTGSGAADSGGAAWLFGIALAFGLRRRRALR